MNNMETKLPPDAPACFEDEEPEIPLLPVVKRPGSVMKMPVSISDSDFLAANIPHLDEQEPENPEPAIVQEPRSSVRKRPIVPRPRSPRPRLHMLDLVLIRSREPSVLCWGQLIFCRNVRACFNLTKPRFVAARSFISYSLFAHRNTAPIQSFLKKISRQHFSVILQPVENGPNTVRITDLSGRGTYVNDKLIGRDETITLFDGDKISLVFPSYHCYTFKDFSNRRPQAIILKNLSSIQQTLRQR